MKFRILLLLCFPFSVMSQIHGLWHTSFTIMGMSKRLDLSLELTAKDTTGWIRDPEMKSQTKIPIEGIKLSGDSLLFNWTGGRLSFEGKYFPKGDSLNGTFHQAGLEWNALFTKEEQVLKKLIRPQEPKPPFPYQEEEVIIENGEVMLSGTLTLPTISGPFPVIVLASGSGAQDRNCDIMGHKPFLVIADYLARNGIACLRFDDRGTGKSTGLYTSSTLEDFALDVKSCVHYLKSDDRFVNSPVGIAGHSEGGMHALMAAQKNKDVSFIIELASVGTSGLDVFLQQQYDIPLKESGDTAMANWNRELFRGACAIVSEEKNAELRTQNLNTYLDSQYEIAPEEVRKSQPLMSFKMSVQMLLNNEWFRQFQDYVAADYLKKLSLPILAINGGSDLQVEPEMNTMGFARGFSKKSRSKSDAVIVPGLNHLMQHCDKCTVSEYSELEETFATEVMETMVEWMKNLPQH
jgi:pimeloyl-ACP methyl ester carboxylesterase